MYRKTRNGCASKLAVSTNTTEAGIMLGLDALLPEYASMSLLLSATEIPTEPAGRTDRSGRETHDENNTFRIPV
jgi:hypothetical protein